MTTPQAPLTTTTSLKPAASVLGIAVATLVVFLSINLVTSQHTTTVTTVPVVVGTLQPDATNTALGPCLSPGQPPTDIASSIVIPAKTAAAGAATVANQGAGDYDCFRTLTTGARQSDVLGFFSAQLGARGWSLFSHAPSVGAGHGDQLLFQKNGSDTFLWIVGVTVLHHGTTSTTYTFRLYQGNNGV